MYLLITKPKAAQKQTVLQSAFKWFKWQRLN